jgi:ribosome-associated protein
VICDAISTTQVKAIADSIEERTGKELKEKPWHVEGIGHREWILLDYVDIVVHVFLKEVRNFYGLEELWSDGFIEEHND